MGILFSSSYCFKVLLAVLHFLHYHNTTATIEYGECSEEIPHQ